MDMDDKFNYEGFCAFMRDNIRGYDGTDGVAFRNTVDNIVNFGLRYKTTTLDSFAYFVSDLLGIAFSEVAQFCPDEWLTEYGKLSKAAQKSPSKETVRQLWEELGDVPTVLDENNYTVIDEPFRDWAKGTDVEEIWHWFDKAYARWGGVRKLMYSFADE